jgi:hypothetical protein
MIASQVSASAITAQASRTLDDGMALLLAAKFTIRQVLSDLFSVKGMFARSKARPRWSNCHLRAVRALRLLVTIPTTTSASAVVRCGVVNSLME